MKLLTKTTLYFLISLVPLLALGGYLLFYQFSSEINKRVDKELVSDEVQWIRYLQSTTYSGSTFVLQSPDVLIQPTNEPSSRFPQITDTRDAKNNTSGILYRQLQHVVPVNGVNYFIRLRKSQEQKAALFSNVLWIMLLVFAGLTVILVLFNWIISKKLWAPFHQTLQKIRSIELGKMQTTHFAKTHTKEFNQLNASLNGMTEKLYTDFSTIKEFTENAAHEMQTPLAIAQTKLELLLQDVYLTQSAAEAIGQASEALQRLQKLNQSLLLMAKIENKQFESTAIISLTDTTRRYLRLFDEWILDKKIQVYLSVKEDFTLSLHPFLTDTLISNLLGNAIKYNKESGRIDITVTATRFCVRNNSHSPAIPANRIFSRFSTGAQREGNSTGLGLAIAKKIADNHHLSLHYKGVETDHLFCLEKIPDRHST